MIEVTLNGQKICSKKSNCKQSGRRRVSKWNIQDRRKREDSKNTLAVCAVFLAIIFIALTFWPVTLTLIAVAILWNILKNRKG